MNKQRRAAIAALIPKIEDLKSELENLQQEEQDYRDNMPENLQESEKAQLSDTALENLDTAVSSVDDVISALNEIAEN
jgi:phage host-nuclease inhibitor protein Gam